MLCSSFSLVFSHVQADAVTCGLLYQARQPEEADAHMGEEQQDYEEDDDDDDDDDDFDDADEDEDKDEDEQ